MSGYADRTLSGMRWSTGGLWYQFMTTGEKVTTLPGEVEGYSGGAFSASAVAVQLPKIKADGSVIWDNVTPIATGSTREALPDPEGETSTDITQISRVKVPIQVQLLTEPVYRGFNNLEKEKSYTQTMYSVASTPGMIYNAGVFMLSPCFGEGGYSADKGFDVPPTAIKGKQAKWRSPNTDWPHDAMRVTVSSEEFGSRRFMVLVDASQHFYCWPDQYDSDAELNAPYASQAQTINVPDSQVQSLIPPFPAWVHVPEGYRRDTDWPFLTNSGEPRYVWRFHPQGTKVVGMVLKRTEFTATVYGKTLTTYTHLPFREVSVGVLEFDADQRDGMDIDYKGPLKNDWPGYVEFSIDIQLTGINKEDFTFGMTVISEQQADATHYPIAADYLSPVLNGWSSYNIDASPGDLVVLNLECYMDTRGRTWVDRHCGYLDTTNNYIRQSFLRVYKVGSETPLLSFVTKDWPEDYSIKKWRLDAPTLITHEGKLSSIDLSKLSFVHEMEKRRMSVDTDTPYFSDSVKNAHQTWYESETGVRYYVFGKKVYQESQGENLNLWSSLDGISEVGSLYNSQELDTRWLYSKNGKEYWLPIQTDISFRDINNSPAVSSTGNEYGISLGLLDRLSGLSTTTVGDSVYQAVTIASNPLNYINVRLSAPLNDDFYSDVFFTHLQFAAGGYAVKKQTGILDELYLGCAAIDRTYYSVLVDWIEEQYEKFLSTVDLNPYYAYEVSGTIRTGDPVGVIEPYGSAIVNFGDEGEILTYTASGTVNGNFIDVEAKDGYRKTEFSFSNDYPIFSSDNDRYLTTYNNNNRQQRIYNYPVGCEVMLREWKNAFGEWTSKALLSCPEGFYAGCLMHVHYTTNKIPHYTLYSEKDYIKEFYGSTLKNALHSTVNQPTTSQFNFFTVDLIGHVNSEETLSHLGLYQTAFNVTLSIPNPPVTVTIENDNTKANYKEYLYKKSVTVDSTTNWFYFNETATNIIYRPILNGSALFSK